MAGLRDPGTLGTRQRLDQQAELLGGDAAVERDALDADLPDAAQQLGKRVAHLHQGDVADDHLVVDEPDGDGRVLGQQLASALGQRLQGPPGQRVRRRVELVRAHRGGHAPDELVGLAQSSGGVAHESLLSLGTSVPSPPAESVEDCGATVRPAG